MPDSFDLQWMENTCTEEWYESAFTVADNIEKLITRYRDSESDIPQIHNSAQIHPTSVIGDNVVVEEDVKIGPFCYIREDTILRQGCRLGYNVEVIKSVIGSGTKIIHMSSVSNSIVGKDVNLGAGFISSTRRLDDESIQVECPFNNQYESSRSHFGTIIGDGVQTGVYVITMPGAVVGHQAAVYPRSTVAGTFPSDHSGFTSL